MQRRSFIKNSILLGAASTGLLSCNFSTKKDAEVIILGAGLAGMYCGLQLMKRGIDFKILEASNRFGGRVFTRNDFHVPVELGGVEIGDGYKRFVQLAKDLNVNLVKPNGYPSEWMIHYKGENLANTQWENHSVNTLSDAFKSLPPYRLESAPLRGKVPYKTTTDWTSHDLKNLDIPYVEYLKAAGYDDEMIRMAGLSANHNGLDKISIAHMMRSYAYRTLGTSKSTFHVEGGTGNIAQKMASHLQENLMLNKKVTSIEENNSSVKVTCGEEEFVADQVICTIPFSVLRDVKLSANLAPNQKAAIGELPYTKITQVLVAVKEKYWLEDGLPVSMWTDSPIERVFAANSAEDEDVILKVFINGENATKADKLSRADLSKMVIDTFTEVRPSAEGKIEYLDSHSWGNYTYNKGAYAEFHAGQVAKFVPNMAKPTDRIYFAGEHCSMDDKGMEGALASAENAVNQFLTSKNG